MSKCMPKLKFFWCSQSNNNYFPCFTKSHWKMASGYWAGIASTPDQILAWSVTKCASKWSQGVLLRADLVTPKQYQCKWNKMKEVNGAKSMAYMKKFGWKVWMRYPMLKFWLHKMASQNSLHRSIVTHMAKNNLVSCILSKYKNKKTNQTTTITNKIMFLTWT